MKSPEAFVRTVYARPGVAAACLALQEQGDVDVVVLLWALWRAMAGVGAPDAEAVRGAARRTGPWRSAVVQPLRAIRREMKEGVPGAPQAAAEPIRNKIKALEIEAELFALDLLAAADHDAEPSGALAAERAAAAAPALRTVYAFYANRPADTDAVAALTAILGAAAPGSDAAALIAAATE